MMHRLCLSFCTASLVMLAMLILLAGCADIAGETLEWTAAESIAVDIPPAPLSLTYDAHIVYEPAAVVEEPSALEQITSLWQSPLVVVLRMAATVLGFLV